MRKISDTIARLAQAEARKKLASVSARASGRLVEFKDFGSNPGALSAYRFVPADLAQGAPLVVVLHGCTQTADGYDLGSGWSQLAAEAGFAVLYPEQKRLNNPSLCFNWFQPSDVRRGAGEAHSIHQMIEAMVSTHGLDRNRIFITGLSAGGAMAASMLANYPETFAGGAIMAGLPHGSATTIPQAFDRMRGHGNPSVPELQKALRDASDHRGPWPRIAIWHGLADQTVSHSNADAIAAQWRAVHKVASTPSSTKTAGPNTRKVWTDATGDIILEVNTLSGMGHGTPIGEGVGTPGPYMLDVGVSSTRAMAQSWGLAAASPDKSRTVAAAARPARARQEDRSVPAKRPAAGQDRRVPPPREAKPTRSETGVKKIIEDALRAAGLMR